MNAGAWERENVPVDVTGQIEAGVEAGVEALKRNAFAEAYEILDKARVAGQLGGEGFEQLAEAALWSGHPLEMLEATEQAFGAYIDEGRTERAGFVALTLAREYGDRQDSVLSGSWYGRAEKLLGEHPDSAEYGYLELMRSFMSYFSGDDVGALERAQHAAALASAHQNRDLQALSLVPQAMSLIHRGDVDEGFKLMDEATVAAVSGELTPMVTGMIYCNTINTCRDLGDFNRASQWTDAAERWCRRTSIAGFPGVCRVRRAEIMALRGSWLEAEREAAKAVQELSDFGISDVLSESFKEIGVIRLRMGDLEGAEDAFSHATEIHKTPQPGHALLRLAQGKPEAAMASIRSALETESWDRLARARLLPALVEIAEQTGDIDAAREASDELSGIARDFDSPAISAAASFSVATVALMGGDFAKAAAQAAESRRLWLKIGAPYESARARVTLGRALLASGDEDSAKLELSAARNGLEKLGALPEARRAGELADAGYKSEPKTTTKTFMFTDIVGSTDLVHLIGDEAWESLLRWHDRELRKLFADHRGEEIKQIGDGFFVAFDDASSAVSSAVAIQRRLVEHRKEHGFAPQVRIGLHSAAALDREGDYGGRGVHEAARIGALAKGGEILASVTSIEGLGLELESGPREVELKGIVEPVSVCTIRWRLDPQATRES